MALDVIILFVNSGIICVDPVVSASDSELIFSKGSGEHKVVVELSFKFESIYSLIWKIGVRRTLWSVGYNDIF